ncbi:methyltransferase domain-containing protein [Desulfolutivibrio sulfoxidireducens]|uniref:methyltransferase domain-containing protein n=1 Tax=Desulfolutivibrio sulfoxidireducens TaxID=2773299 RepID=UPI00159D1C8C|nr:methyltransferase domain-containing protein [Desulfolutivibrio sulfoxidireducens]QLA17494.1 methyltransferase domain-containing protein [Desulfolutivibrio sulfoxidireducens]QLA21079.1 methyltransferase domain-containing protein [Desulfolutivibrio sulfoxidireducens]
MSGRGYVHGYGGREAERLLDQAGGLAGLLHHDTAYPPGARVLEAGCGVGAQTVILAAKSPGADIVSVDISPESLDRAREAIRGAGIENVRFEQADVTALPFPDDSFDHIFVCFVLEHLPDPQRALAELKRVLVPGGTITAIEGDHGSCYFHPETPAGRAAWNGLVASQARLGGDSLIGRRVYPLLAGAGFTDVEVSPRHVYSDGSRPEVAEAFVRKIIVPMVQGARRATLEAGLCDAATFDAGVADLLRTAEPDGSFCYTFFKGTARK